MMAHRYDLGPRKPGKHVAITLQQDLIDALWAYMQREQIVSPAEGARQLIRIGLSSDPEETAQLSARIRAYNETKHWQITNLRDYFVEQLRLLEQTLAEERAVRSHAE